MKQTDVYFETDFGRKIRVPTHWSNLSVRAWLDMQKVGTTFTDETKYDHVAAACRCDLALTQSLSPALFAQAYALIKALFEEPLSKEPLTHFTHKGRRFDFHHFWAIQGTWDEIAVTNWKDGQPEFGVAYLANHFWAKPTLSPLQRLKLRSKRKGGGYEWKRHGFEFELADQYRLESEAAIYELDVESFNRLVFFWTCTGKSFGHILRFWILHRLQEAKTDLAAQKLKALTMRWPARWVINMALLWIEFYLTRFTVSYHNSMKSTFKADIK